MIEHRVRINGIEGIARYTEREREEIFLPLLQKITALRRQKGKRVLVMLAAPPGAGKSTLASFLERLSRETPGLERLQVLGMDGFHRRQEYLLTHEVPRDGRLVRMVEIKGAPVTFDLEALSERVKKAAAGERCGWPVYDRMLHNPVEDALTVEGEAVLLEGNYLLLREDGWRDLAAFADLTVFLRAPEALLRARLIDRRVKTGVPEEAAARFVDFSDMPNARLCLTASAQADLEMELDETGECRVRGAGPRMK